ncbi:TonB-dependent siderophore receptor [Undibacterium sp. Ji49W]|uniref:TonB-dependent siderophore receptor n=1 Tax=Undibacterium sp. Ji49W TaxID=3413040 RepID=UPI003BF11658
MSHKFYPRLSILVAATCPLLATAADSNTANDQAGSEVLIQSQRQNYRGISATGATKTDALLADLPQSVRVLTADLLKDNGVTSLNNALDLTSGIARQSNLGGLWDSYAMRGFTGDPNFGSDYMVNGFNSSRGYNGLRDTANTQSIEVLKGPSSALYGRGEPGGTVNIMTKKPRFKPEYDIDLSLASHQTYRVAADLTGPVSENIAYRINAAVEQGDSYRDTISSKRSFVSPSLVWLIGERTTLSYELEASEQKTPFDRGVLAVNGKLGLIPNSRFLGEPGDGPVTVKSLGHQVFIQHDFNQQWSLQSGLSYRDSELRGFSTEANNLLADERTLRRQRRYRDFSATDRSARVELVGKFDTAAIRHNVLLGIDSYQFDDSRVQLRRNPSATNAYAIDIYNPVYGKTADPLALSVNTLENQKARGLYLQDQLDLAPQWKALFGLRSDHYDQTLTNYRVAVATSQSLSATSPRAGLVYQPMSGVSLYASAAKGFRPNSGISISNTAFPAEESRSYEVGVKFDTPDNKTSATIALYRIKKTNVLTTNPANTDFSIAAGEVGSKGLEMDVAGDIIPNLRLSAAYAYTDATVTKGDNTIVTGSRFPNVAKHSANLILSQLFSIGTARASLGAGINYVGERLGDVAVSSNFTLPAYTTVKLMSSYSPSKATRLSLNVDNLFNKRYYASSYSQLWVAPGTERSVSLNLHQQF